MIDIITFKNQDFANEKELKIQPEQQRNRALTGTLKNYLSGSTLTLNKKSDFSRHPIDKYRSRDTSRIIMASVRRDHSFLNIGERPHSSPDIKTFSD